MITGDVVNVRAQAGTGYDIVAKVVEYSVLDVVDEVQGQDGYIWYLVNVDGKVGYVRGDLIEITEPILPLVKQEEIGQRTLMEASVAIAQQLSQASVELGMSPRILNIEKILTAEELEGNRND